MSNDEVSSLTRSSTLLAGNGIAVLVHIEPGASDHLLAGGGKRAGQRHDHSRLLTTLAAFCALPMRGAVAVAAIPSSTTRLVNMADLH